MDHVIDKFIERNKLLKRGSVVVVGVSGGPDSMAMLHYLLKWRHRSHVKVVVAHMDHMFRGQESAEDAQFVTDYCKEHSIELMRTKRNLPFYIDKTGESPQKVARDFRYRFFAEVMERHNADYLALAHHGDDQIETMLMNMSRGTSTAGLSGIPVCRPYSTGSIIRPFLCVTKEDILNYCKENEIRYRIDPSNDDVKYTRNRFRQKILPFLKEENQNVHERFQSLSETLFEDESYMKRQAEAELEEATLKKCDNQMTLSVPRFLQGAIPLQRRGIHLILNYLYSSNQENIMSNHIKDCLLLINSKNPSGTLDLPGGLTVRRIYEKCTFTFGMEEENSAYKYSLYSGETYHLPVGMLKYQMESGMKSYQKGKDYLVLASSQVKLPLNVRTRVNGDRIRPVGLQGSRKIKDVFIDAKVPKHLRDIWPIVTDSTGEIIWIPGVKHAELPPASDQEKDWIFLSFENTRHEV